ncbi:MAG: hypothetical protein AAGF95_17195 [Chloroflexota bacterium]
MTLSTSSSILAAFKTYPGLHQQVRVSLDGQARRITERTTPFIPNKVLIETIDRQLKSLDSGLITLVAPMGGGATSLLCHLAVTRPYLFWFPEDDRQLGIEALCAQLIAGYNLPLPLLPPTVSRDAVVLEGLLSEAAASRQSAQPLVVLIDQFTNHHVTTRPPIFPAIIPHGVIVMYAHEPGLKPPMAPKATIDLMADAEHHGQMLYRFAVQLGCDDDLAARLVAQSGGSFLYIRLAAKLLTTGLFTNTTLPQGLTALYEKWWKQLGSPDRKLAQLLAAAGAPIALSVCTDITGMSIPEVARLLQSWAPFLEVIDQRVTFYHHSIRTFIQERSRSRLATSHTAFLRLAQTRSGGHFEELHQEADPYLLTHVARHLALSTISKRKNASHLLSRSWIRMHERHTGNLKAAANDAAWDVYRANRLHLVADLVRATALAGTLTLLGRTLPVDEVVSTFVAALKRGDNRDDALRRIRTLVDQLPDGRDKAIILRRLGEVCYEHRMRASAMRMLAEALDLEEPELPRSWRDEREEALVAFARAAIKHGVPDIALGITTQIGHAERRGFIETEVVRSLLAQDRLTRAEEVAHAIGHEHTHEWAMAEVAVGHARAGRIARAVEVLDTLKTETAVAWAQGELACDTASTGQSDAIKLVQSLPNEYLRDQALALVVQALVEGKLVEEATTTAHQIINTEIRTQSFIDLALATAAKDMLDRAAQDVAAVEGDNRMPLIVALATTYAIITDETTALKTASLLMDEEERNRAHSRIAVTLARQGDHPSAAQIALAIPDEDERSWTLHELARLLGEAGEWNSAMALIDQISDSEERARAEADVCIARARSGNATVAQQQVALITIARERIRAYVAIVDSLVQQGRIDAAKAITQHITEPDARSRYQAALVTALAHHHDIREAQQLSYNIIRPFDRARTLIVIAQLTDDLEQKRQVLGQAFQMAASLGRSETFTCLASAAEPLASLEGAEALLAASHALDEIDEWWVG